MTDKIVELINSSRTSFAPLIAKWIEDRHANGDDPELIRVMLTAEALSLASSAHVGSETAFMKMAAGAIESDKKQWSVGKMN